MVGGYSKVESKLNDLRMETQTSGSESTKADASINEANKTYLHSKEMDVTAAADESSFRMGDFSKDERQVEAGGGSFGNEENAAHIGDGHLSVLKQQVSSLKNSHDIVILRWCLVKNIPIISFLISRSDIA